MSTHTKEPWVIGTDGDLEGADGSLIHGTDLYYPTAIDPDDMKRIVACVNYCTGMTTEELESPSNRTPASNVVESNEHKPVAPLGDAGKLVEALSCFNKISAFCPPDPTIDQLDDSEENSMRLHLAEIGDTARAGISALSTHLAGTSKGDVTL
jgi:hypothetical protein